MAERATHRGYTAGDQDRWVPEPAKRPDRGPFERDRARVLHAASLRRLAAKTQVVGPASDDFVRNRLTHTLEVAQVGREIGSALGCDADVVDTACLAHDLGHPPFGHNGESVLDAVAASAGGFEGNAQTLRLLTRLEPKVLHPDGSPAGLNLTRASLDAATKYPWPRRDTGGKFGMYAADAAAFAWLRDGAPEGRRCLEAQVMDLADDVAYSVHDVEDAVVAGRLSPNDLDDAGRRRAVATLTVEWYLPGGDADEVLAALDRLRALPYWVARYDADRRSLAALKDMTSQLIGRFAGAVQAATHAAYGKGALTRYAADLVVPPAVRLEIAVLKGVAAAFVMTAEDRQAVYAGQRELLAELCDALLRTAPAPLQPAYAADWTAAADDADRLRVVVDQVASLTDASAERWHQRLVAGWPDP